MATHHDRFLINLSVALIVCGALFLIFGAIATTPSFSGFLLRPLQGNLLGEALEAGTMQLRALSPEAVPFALHVPSSVFLAGTLLVTGGACIDVARRMKRL